MQCNICEFRCNIPKNGKRKYRMYRNKHKRIDELYPDRYLVSVLAPIGADELYNNLFGADYAALNHNRTFDVLRAGQLKKRSSTLK